MSTKGTVESIERSKSGKSWRVKIGSGYYGANFDSKIDTMLGKPIDFEWENGKFGKWLQSWGPDTTAPSAGPSRETSIPGPTPVRGNGDRWWLPFVSNQCAHAIAAGHIKGAADLRSWAVAAREAIEAADEAGGVPY